MSFSPGFFADEKTVTRLMHLQFPGDKVRRRRQHVTILADARDLARLLQFMQRLIQSHAHAALASEHLRQIHLRQRLILRRAQHRQDPLLQFFIRIHLLVVIIWKFVGPLDHAVVCLSFRAKSPAAL